jgi:hypothetical protein
MTSSASSIERFAVHQVERRDRLAGEFAADGFG